MINLKQLLLII